MVELYFREWTILIEIARALKKNIEETDVPGLYTTGTMLTDDEVKVLRKIAEHKI